MNKVRKAIIPAAGLGTRFLPITKAIPKPMLSVLDKPTIQYITEELFEAGIEDIIIVVSGDSKTIKDHFGKADKLEKKLLKEGKIKLYEIEQQTRKFNVQFAIQEEANGLAGAILSAEELCGGEPFALLLGDELIYTKPGEKSCLSNLLEVFEKTGNSTIATIEIFGDDISKYGNIGIKEEKDGVISVDRIIEKPSINQALSNNAIIGRYVLSSEIWGLLKQLMPRNGEIYLTDALDILAEESRLNAIVYNGARYDVGDKFGYIKANIEYALRSDEIGADVKDFIISIGEKL